MVNAPDWIKQDKKLLLLFTRCHSQPRCIQSTLGHLAIMDMSLLQTESTSIPGWNYKKMYGNNSSFKGSAIVEFGPEVTFLLFFFCYTRQLGLLWTLARLDAEWLYKWQSRGCLLWKELTVNTDKHITYWDNPVTNGLAYPAQCKSLSFMNKTSEISIAQMGLKGFNTVMNNITYLSVSQEDWNTAD